MSASPSGSSQARTRSVSLKRSPGGAIAHHRDVGGHDLPAEVGEAHPGLGLAADRVATADLELQVHGGEVAAEREDLQTDAPLLDAGPGRARHPVRVDGREAVAVLVECVA